MKIDKDLMQTMKDVPNSPYSVISPYFLFHSNRLEGSTFSERDFLEGFDRKSFFSMVGGHPHDEIVEARSSFWALDNIVDTLGEPITHDFLIDLNNRLFRNTSYVVSGYIGCYKEFTALARLPKYRLPEYRSELDAILNRKRHAIDELLEWWESSNKDLAAICHFHLRFEQIDPFHHGNGRIGRYLVFKQCVENNVDLPVIEEGSKTYRNWIDHACFNFYDTDELCKRKYGDESCLLEVMEGAQRRFELKMKAEGITEEMLSEYRAKIPMHKLARKRMQESALGKQGTDAPKHDIESNER